MCVTESVYDQVLVMSPPVNDDWCCNVSHCNVSLLLNDQPFMSYLWMEPQNDHCHMWYRSNKELLEAASPPHTLALHPPFLSAWLELYSHHRWRQVVHGAFVLLKEGRQGGCHIRLAETAEWERMSKEKTQGKRGMGIKTGRRVHVGVVEPSPTYLLPALQP